MCSLVVGWPTRSLREIKAPQTPSFDQVAIDLGWEMSGGFLEPLEDLQPALVRQRPERNS